MFTGIVTDVGELVSIEKGHLRVRSSYDPASIEIGASIAHDGCCLTVTDLEPVEGGCIHGVDVGAATMIATTIGFWYPGRRINLERALGLGEELGGHLVTGHVDAVATVVSWAGDPGGAFYTIEVPRELARFIAVKGSVALNGVSLTVNRVEGNRFEVGLIPHTLKQTTWGQIEAGARINLEIDLLARYVARLNEMDSDKDK